MEVIPQSDPERALNPAPMGLGGAAHFTHQAARASPANREQAVRPARWSNARRSGTSADVGPKLENAGSISMAACYAPPILTAVSAGCGPEDLRQPSGFAGPAFACISCGPCWQPPGLPGCTAERRLAPVEPPSCRSSRPFLAPLESAPAGLWVRVDVFCSIEKICAFRIVHASTTTSASYHVWDRRRRQVVGPNSSGLRFVRHRPYRGCRR